MAEKKKPDSSNPSSDSSASEHSPNSDPHSQDENLDQASSSRPKGTGRWDSLDESAETENRQSDGEPIEPRSPQSSSESNSDSSYVDESFDDIVYEGDASEEERQESLDSKTSSSAADSNDPNVSDSRDPLVGDARGGDEPPPPPIEVQPNTEEEAEPTAETESDGDGPTTDAESESSEAEDDQPEITVAHTSLKCLSLIARHHGVDYSYEGLAHEYSLETEEPSERRLMRIAKDIGFKTRRTRLNWKQLNALGDAYPLMARLENGNFVILVGIKDVETEDGKVTQEVAVFDPLADRHDFLFLKQTDLEKSWKGDVILLKRQYSLLDKDQPFSLRWFIPEVFRQRVAFMDVAIGAIFIHAIALVTPLFFQIVIDKVIVNFAMETLTTITIGIGVALFFDALLNFLRGYLLLHATSKIDVRVATRTFRHMLSLPTSFFEQITAGVLTKHMQQTSTIREFLTGSLFMTLLEATALFVFLPILFFYSVQLSLVVLIFSALLAAVIGVLLNPYRRRLEALYKAEGDRQAMLVESIHGIQTVKALAMEPVQRKKWDEKSSQAVMMHFRVGKISITARSLSQFLEKTMTVTIVVVGASLVFAGELSIGALVAFQMIAGRVSGPLVQLVSLVHSYQEAALSVRMLGQVMNRPSESGMGVGLRPPVEGRIEFEGVSFNYSPTSPPALDDVNLAIPAGKIVGVVGRSGSGKTTLTRLMQGLYPTQRGIIRIDRIDIRELDKAHLRRNIGVVLQENFLFRGPVRENIAMAKTNATFQEIIYAAKLAGADEFIERLPQSYDTILEENGSNLSGGQKQRLAIARALLTDPRILIFDEATSALDPESEAIIQANLRHIAQGRTVVIVSHRLTTLTKCDAIVVIERGRIESIGNHEYLLNNSKVYSELWSQQVGQL